MKKRCTRCLGKKGDSQVDWVMAGSIFVLFLVFFFITVKPVFFTPEEEKVSTRIIEEKLKSELFWTIQKIPILIRTDRYHNSYPVRAKIEFTSESNPSLALSDNTTSYIDRGYFFTVKPINTTIFYEAAFSNKTYEEGYGSFELSATASNATSHDLTVEFADSMIEEIKHQGMSRLTNIELTAGEYLALPEFDSFTDASLLGRYHSRFGNLNNTYYVYAGSSIIDQRISTEYETSVNLELHGYFYHHVNEKISGNETGCFYESRADSAIFYSQESGLLMKFEDSLPITFCVGEDYTTKVNISVSRKNDSWIRYAFYTGNLDDALAEKNITSMFGMPRDVSGASEEKLALLNMTSYQTLKSDWEIPEGRDFKITLMNTTTSIGPTPPDWNLFAKNYDENMMDKFGTKTSAKFSLQVW